MSKQAVELIFNGTFSETPIGSYDPTKISRGNLIRQYSLSASPDDNFLSPTLLTVLRPQDQSTAIPAGPMQIIQWSTTQWWVFYADLATATTSRRIGLFTYDPTTGTQSWRGFITVTPPSVTNHTVRGFRVSYQKYTTGTASTSGTAVTGSGTAWLTSRLAVGSRIGFGSTDPTQISTWYEISAVGSDTTITLTSTAGTIGAGPYVIEELRVMVADTASTATNSGFFVAKGLRYDLWIPAGTTIAAATTVDNIRATYWLADASTVTNTTVAGCAQGSFDSWTQEYYYVLDGASTTSKCYRYNMRAALSGLASGKQILTGTDILITGAFTVTGNQSQNNNGRVANVAHGPGNGVNSLYFVTTTRIYRAALTSIVAASTTWVDDQMTENPPGSSATNALTGALNSIDYASSIDRFIITTTSARAYVSQYRTDAGQMDHLFAGDHKQLDEASEDSTAQPIPSTGSIAMNIWSEGGILFFCRQGAATPTVALNQIWTIPIGAHWKYTRGVISTPSLQYAIAPKITLGSTVTKLYRVWFNTAEFVNGSGGFSDQGHGPEAVRLLYRTSGIDDNSGSWTQAPFSGDMSGVTPGSGGVIQFAFEWRTIGVINIPGRVYGVCLAYESSDSLPAQYQWDYNDSDVTSGNFGFVQKTLWSITIPTHTINIYRADTDALVLTQASTSTTNGVFEYWNGSSWTAGLGTDVVGTRRRFRPTSSLPASVDLYAKITTS